MNVKTVSLSEEDLLLVIHRLRKEARHLQIRLDKLKREGRTFRPPDGRKNSDEVLRDKLLRISVVLDAAV